MTAIQSFAPLLGEKPRLLILGSIPGTASLQAQQYYAHPRNQFWPIMQRLCGAGPQLAYADRCQRLRQCGVALWDVIGECRRVGSLDAAIEHGSEQLNALQELIEAQADLQCVACNGTTAWRNFCRKALSSFDAQNDRCTSVATDRGEIRFHEEKGARTVRLLALPSTSPAHAAMSLEQKWQRWSQLAYYVAASDVAELDASEFDEH